MKVFLTILIFISSTNLFSQARISSFDKYDIEIIKKLKHLKNDSILINKKYPIQKINNQYYLSLLGKKDTSFDQKSYRQSKIIVKESASQIVSVKIPIKELDQINSLKGFENLSISKKIDYSLDKALIDTRADSVHMGINLPQSYTGKNVYIGVTDWGFDYTSPMFYDTTLTSSRIVAAWDQYKRSGPPPAGFNYGTEYGSVESLLDAQSDTSNIYSYATHGTHVAGIAGGSGAGTQYRGIAFDAKFLFCTFLVDEASVLDAWQWMFEKASEDGKRLVVNMSWGLYHMGTLDGSSLLSQAISDFSDLGVIFVNSGGNNGNVNFHLSKYFTETDTLIKSKIDFYSYASNPNMWGQSIHAWGEPTKQFSIGLEVLDNSNNYISETPFFKSNSPISSFDSILVIGIDTIFYNLQLDSSNIFNNRPGIRLRVKNMNTAYKIIMRSKASDGLVHYWNVTELTNDVGNWGMPFSAAGIGTSIGNNENGISEPSCSDDVISVAAYATQYQVSNGAWVGGARASFSSIGPRFDGVMKPDISAPGVAIISSMSSFTDVNFTSMADVDFGGRNYKFAKLSGTSMAAPMVTGVVALVLEVNPYLTAEQIKDIIISTARQDNYTGSIPDSGNVMWGHGKVNAYEAVKMALETIGVNESILNLNWNLYPNPVSEFLHFTLVDEIPEKAIIFNQQGHEFEVLIKDDVINVNFLPQGKYIMRIIINGKVQHRPFIKL